MLRPLLYAFSILGTATAAWWGGVEHAVLADEALEPQRAYMLSLDGKQFELQPGESIQIEGKFNDPQVQLDLGETRHFEYGGLVFDYPAHYVWEADIVDSSFKMWTMDGADVSLIVVSSEYLDSALEYALDIESALEEEGLIDEISRSLQGFEYNGARLVVSTAGVALTYEIYEIPCADGITLVVAMDATDSGLPSSEFQELMTLFDQTLAPAEVAALLSRKAELEDEIAVWEVTYDDDHAFLKELRDELAKIEAKLKSRQQ